MATALKKRAESGFTLPEGDALMTHGDAAKFLAQTSDWLYSKAWSGEIRSIKIGKFRRYRRSDLLEFINRTNPNFMVEG